MTAAALLVVLGAALAMQVGGLSMAMGAFLAGVLLSESSFRHQLEADIEPFRGLLLGLFFLGVGMSLDLDADRAQWPRLPSPLGRRLHGAEERRHLRRRAGSSAAATPMRSASRFLLAQGGEFAFVLYATAAGDGIFSPETTAFLTAAVILSMALTPLAPLVLKRLIPTRERLRSTGSRPPTG